MQTNEYDESHKQIEDVINAKMESGQYDILINNLKPSLQNSNVRYAYSTPAQPINDARDDSPMYNIEGENNNDIRMTDFNIVGPTDSEITVIRVKREGSQFRTQIGNNWDMQDRAIPGDGTHLGDSPSLVNLVTLVTTPSKQNVKTQNNEVEYMLPLSSWEPNAAEAVSMQDGEDAGKRRSQQSCTESTKRRGFMDLLGCLFRRRSQQEE